jgi:ribosomal protein L37AE/L43A
VPSKATKTEDATAKQGVCGQCGKETVVHWSATHVGWRCRDCHAARAAVEYVGGRGLDREVLGDVTPAHIPDDSDSDDGRLP